MEANPRLTVKAFSHYGVSSTISDPGNGENPPVGKTLHGKYLCSSVIFLSKFKGSCVGPGLPDHELLVSTSIQGKRHNS